MAGPTLRKIIHVDMDAFFAPVEQRDNPELRGKPVAVGYPAARGVVAAARCEACAFEVRSALPSVPALRRCPQLIFVPPRFEVYKELSRQIHAIFAECTDLIQPLTFDEVYLDATADRRGPADRLANGKGNSVADPARDPDSPLQSALRQQSLSISIQKSGNKYKYYLFPGY